MVFICDLQVVKKITIICNIIKFCYFWLIQTVIHPKLHLYMEERKLILLTLFFFFSKTANTQTTAIGTPKLDFDGSKLTITYDMIEANPSDQYYVWVLIQKKDGEVLKLNSITGDIGDTKPGNGKVITWVPGNDSVFLNEEVTVEVQAEKYVKSYNKGSALVKSLLLPGLGQTKMSGGKPYWIMGLVSYGALAGGLVTYSAYKDSYNKYLSETEDPQKRADYLSESEKKATMAGAMFVTAAAIWTANLIWVAATPNKYQPLKYKPITLSPSADLKNGAALMTFRYNF